MTEETRSRILVVDDDRALTDLLRMILEDAGYDVRIAANGREAVYAAVADPPDVIVLDIVMPEMNGWETSDHLLSHERTSRIPIIFLSARTGADDQLRGWYRGAFDYLTKPFDMPDLLEKIRQALRSPTGGVDDARAELRQQRIAALEQIVGESD